MKSLLRILYYVDPSAYFPNIFGLLLLEHNLEIKVFKTGMTLLLIILTGLGYAVRQNSGGQTVFNVMSCPS